MSKSANKNNNVEEDEIDILEILSYLVKKWKFLSLFIILGGCVGLVAALWVRPSYTSDILLQVDAKGNKSAMALGDMGALFSQSTPAVAEMELLKSRRILSQVIDQEKLAYVATPIGKKNRLLHKEGRMDLDLLQIPRVVAEKKIQIEAKVVKDSSEYTVYDSEGNSILSGLVGETYRQPYAGDTFVICVSHLYARAGQKFTLSLIDKQVVLEVLLSSLTLTEEGKSSGIIRVSTSHRYPDKVANILNSIANLYVRQNVEMRSAEAEKTLKFLNEQIPGIKARLDSAEQKLTTFRYSKGTVDLTGEAKVHLEKDLELQKKLLELEQKKQEARRLFREEHPAVQTIVEQQNRIKAELAKQQRQASNMPSVQQEVVRLQEEVEVNTKQYMGILNNIQQLEVVRGGEVGNVRIVDFAYEPLKPSKPNRKLIFIGVVIVFLLIGCAIALLRRMTNNGVVSSIAVEQTTGIGVYGKLPSLGGSTFNDVHHPYVSEMPDQPFSEGIRALQTALEFSIFDDENSKKTLLVSGLIAGVGKSFVSTNLATSFAMSGKKVLLVDVDLRRGHFFKQNQKGLCEMLKDEVYTDEYIVHAQKNLDVLGSGGRVVNPANLLGGHRFSEFLSTFRDKYDLIVLDSPPIFQCSDALLVEKHADYLLCVLKFAAHTMDNIQDALTSFDRGVSTPIQKAFVFNKCDSSLSNKYGSYSTYTTKF